MSTTSDAELLSQYARNRSEAAFSEIVRRYASLVYSAARRQTDDVEQAHDVVQMVFTDLARKAGTLSGTPQLTGWLYRGVRLQTFELRRKDQRRQRREKEAMKLHDISAPPASDWSTVRPILDDAMASLDDKDRNALLLRFFKNESLASVGGALGLGEDAAQKRVSRALDKLRAVLARRGINTSEAALAATLTAHALETAPGGAESAWVAGALANAPLAPSSFLPLFSTKAALLTAALAGGLIVLCVLHSRALRQVQELQAALQTQAKDFAATRAELDQLKSRLANMPHDSRAREIARLRAKVDRLESAAKTAAARSPHPSTEAGPTNTPVSIQQLVIQCECLTLPSSLFDDSMDRLMYAHQAQSTISGLTNHPDVNLIKLPRVTTLFGRQAHLAAEDTVTIGNETTNVGLALNISPETNDDGAIGMQVSLRGTRLTAQSTIEAVTDSETFLIPDGNVIVFERDIPGEGPWFNGDPADASGPRMMLVFLTPTLIDAAGNRLRPDDVSPSETASGIYPGKTVYETTILFTNTPSALPGPSASIFQNPSGIFPPGAISPASNATPQ